MSLTSVSFSGQERLKSDLSNGVDDVLRIRHGTLSFFLNQMVFITEGEWGRLQLISQHLLFFPNQSFKVLQLTWVKSYTDLEHEVLNFK